MPLPLSRIVVQGFEAPSFSKVILHWPDYGFFPKPPVLDIHPIWLSVYLWYLRHPEGIDASQAREDSSSFRPELEDSLARIYYKVRTGYSDFDNPARFDERGELVDQVHDILNGNSLRVYRSNTNRQIETSLGARHAEPYLVRRLNGGVYGTLLGQDMPDHIVWED